MRRSTFPPPSLRSPTAEGRRRPRPSKAPRHQRSERLESGIRRRGSGALTDLDGRPVPRLTPAVSSCSRQTSSPMSRSAVRSTSTKRTFEHHLLRCGDAHRVDDVFVRIFGVHLFSLVGRHQRLGDRDRPIRVHGVFRFAAVEAMSVPSLAEISMPRLSVPARILLLMSSISRKSLPDRSRRQGSCFDHIA